jgi:hypothetical protein
MPVAVGSAGTQNKLMPIIRACSTEGCSTLTMGQDCIEHELPVPATVVFPRGRPLDQLSRAPAITPDILDRGRMFRLHEAAELADGSVA